MFSFPDAARALGVALQCPELSCRAKGASLDTRTLQPANLFIALKGAKEDGHRFLAAAFEKGASGALIEEAYLKSGRASLSGLRNLLVSKSPAEDLLKLAAWHRSNFQPRTIAVTGSVGKTSTKEFLRYILSQSRPVLSSRGNFNNHLGLPLTLLDLEAGHAYCAAELGANHPGEIRMLAGILKPDHAIITKIAPAHLEGFGSLEAIYDAKLEILESLGAGGCAVLPDDDERLLTKARKFGVRIVTVGFTDQACCRVSDVKTESGRVRFRFDGKEYAFPGIGGFLAQNAAMALAAAREAGADVESVPEFWRDFSLPAGRFEEKELPSGARVIFDGYNASPAAFQAALQAYDALEVRGRRILVFSDMLELGPDEKKYHEELGERVAASRVDLVIAYGSRSRWAMDAALKRRPGLETRHFESAPEAAGYVKHILRSEDTVLLKASRGMKIETVLEAFAPGAEDAGGDRDTPGVFTGRHSA